MRHHDVATHRSSESMKRYRKAQDGDRILVRDRVGRHFVALWILGSVAPGNGWQEYAVRSGEDNPRRAKRGDGGLGRQWWRFAWNGQRVARQRQMGELAERCPEVRAWIDQKMAELEQLGDLPH